MSLDDIRKAADDLAAKLHSYNPTPTPTPTPTPIQKVHVDATNFKQVCTNLGSIDFTGTTDKRVRMTSGHCNMEIPSKFTNPLMVFKGKVIKGISPYWFQLKQKGGSHMNDNPCPGCAYIARVLPDGTITFGKELEHLKSPASGYCDNRRDSVIGTKKVLANTECKVGFSCINGSGNVRLIAMIDDQVVATYTDKGDWSCDDSAFKTDCDARAIGNTGFRKRNELLQKAQEKSILRIDNNTVLEFEYMDVSET